MEIKGKLPQLIAIAVAIAIVLLIVRPYIGALAFAALLAYLAYPLYRRMSKKIPESAAAMIITATALILTVLAVFYGITIALNETAKIYQFISSLPLETYSPTIEDVIRQFIGKSIGTLSDLVYRLPHFALSFFIFFISLFYFLKDGKRLSKWIIDLLPFKEAKKDDITQNIKRQASAFVHVQLVIGLLQGIVAGVGFYFFGLPYPLLAGIAAGLLSVLPILGPYLLYFPVGILVALQGDVQTGLGILIYGVILASLLDYLVRPYLIGRRAQVHPLIIFIGILGGLSLLGIAGIFVGPILLSIAIIVLKEVQEGLSKS
jgi:predicted PurR-regulated permease PerM